MGTPRRLHSAVLPLLGLVALAWALVGLGLVFARERDAALAAAAAQRATLEQYAGAALAEALRTRLAATTRAMNAAALDPLAPAEGLLLVEGGVQRLPRVAGLAAGDGAPAAERYARLARGAEAAEPDDETWAARLALMQRVDRALARPAALDRELSALLLHRATYRVSTQRDLPAMVLLLERLLTRAAVSGEALRGLLRDGVMDAQGGRVEGLQRQALLQRGRLTRGDLDFLAPRLAALSERAGVPGDDFRARVAELAPAPEALPAALEGPSLVGRWYVEPQRGQVLRGVAVDAASLVAEVEAQMRAGGLLPPGATVRPPAAEGAVRLAGLRLPVEAPAWEAARAGAAQAYRLKTLLLGVCGALAVAVVGVSRWAQVRGARFVQLKEDFVAATSHELRTPLASIRLLAETLLRRIVSHPREAEGYAQRIVREADGLGHLVENLLSFSRVDRGRWQPRLAPVRLEELLAAVRDDLLHWSERPLDVRLELAGAEVEADAELLRLLFSNLGRNACAYNTRERVELAVRAVPGGRVHVTDNGVGIPRAAWERAFEDFVRLRGQGPEVAGSGLGLALCRRIMALHGGSIRVAESGSAGTTFELQFREVGAW